MPPWKICEVAPFGHAPKAVSQSTFSGLSRIVTMAAAMDSQAKRVSEGRDMVFKLEHLEPRVERIPSKN